MRSDKKKKTDPNRDIDDFLSKFDEMADEDSKDFSDYLDEEDKKDSKSSKQVFQWKEIAAVKSSGKKSKQDNSERLVVKDPAPSSIKVERKPRDQEDNFAAVLAEETNKDKKPEAVEPTKASDFKSNNPLPSDDSKEKSENKKEKH